MRDVEILALPSQLNEPDRTVCEKPEDYPIRTETAVAAVVGEAGLMVNMLLEHVYFLPHFLHRGQSHSLWRHHRV